MVMLAVNSEDEFGRGENELWILDRIRFQRKKVEGRTGNDMEVLDWQIREGYELQKEIDEKAGGYGKVWLANNLVQELVLVGTQQAQQALRGKESVTVKGALAYQTCNDKECFNPVSVFCPGR